MKYLESYKNFPKKFAHKWNSETPVEIMLPNYLDEEKEKERMQKEWEEANEEGEEDRHLKKFSESIEEELDIEYIRQCFIELIEDDSAAGEIDTMVWDEAGEEAIEGGGKTECTFYCYEPVVNMDIESEEGYFTGIEKVEEFSKNLRSAISRLRDEYPSYKIAFHCELQEGDMMPLKQNVLMKTYQRCIVLDISK